MAGSCYLESPATGVRTYVDEDPARYDDAPPARRVSSHDTDGGTRVVQDFGVADCDRTLRASFGWMSGSTLAAFDACYRAVGAAWLWHDHKGRVYLVVVSSLKSERIRGHDAYRVDVELAVLEVRV